MSDETFGSASGATIAALFRTSDMMVPMVLGDLSEAQLRERTRDGDGPSVAWSVGHLLACRDIMLGHCGVASSGHWGSFMNSQASDGSDYPSGEELRTAWTEMSERFVPAIEALTEEQLSAEVENGWHPGQKLRELVLFLTWHEAYHVGAIGQIRKTIGMPGPAELMMAARQETAEGDSRD